MPTRKQVLQGIKLDHSNRIKIDRCAIYRLRGMLYLFNWRRWVFDIRDVYALMEIEPTDENKLLVMPSTLRYENQVLPILLKLKDEKLFNIILFEAITYGETNYRLDRKSIYESIKQSECPK